MTYRLTANKTKLYKLAASIWPDIQPMRETEFAKAYRSRDCWLTFRTGKYPNTSYHKVFLMTSCGKVVLCDDGCSCNDDDTETEWWEVHHLDMDTLRRFGLLEEVPDLKEMRV